MQLYEFLVHQKPLDYKSNKTRKSKPWKGDHLLDVWKASPGQQQGLCRGAGVLARPAAGAVPGGGALPVRTFQSSLAMRAHSSHTPGQCSSAREDLGATEPEHKEACSRCSARRQGLFEVNALGSTCSSSPDHTLCQLRARLPRYERTGKGRKEGQCVPQQQAWTGRNGLVASTTCSAPSVPMCLESLREFINGADPQRQPAHSGWHRSAFLLSPWDKSYSATLSPTFTDLGLLSSLPSSVSRGRVPGKPVQL